MVLGRRKTETITQVVTKMMATMKSRLNSGICFNPMDSLNSELESLKTSMTGKI